MVYFFSRGKILLKVAIWVSPASRRRESGQVVGNVVGVEVGATVGRLLDDVERLGLAVAREVFLEEGGGLLGGVEAEGRFPLQLEVVQLRLREAGPLNLLHVPVVHGGGLPVGGEAHPGADLTHVVGVRPQGVVEGSLRGQLHDEHVRVSGGREAARLGGEALAVVAASVLAGAVLHPQATQQQVVGGAAARHVLEAARGGGGCRAEGQRQQRQKHGKHADSGRGKRNIYFPGRPLTPRESQAVNYGLAGRGKVARRGVESQERRSVERCVHK